jgi:hypothetical protein
VRASQAGGSFNRPGIVTLLAVLNLIGGVTGVGFALLFALGGMRGGGAPELAPILAGIGALYGAIGALQVATGVGLLGLKPWARTLQIVLAAWRSSESRAARSSGSSCWSTC